MPLTTVSAYRIGGYKFTNADFDPNADIEISKLGTRTLWKSFQPTSFVLSTATRINSGVFGGILMPDSGSSHGAFSFQLPDEYASGDITLVLVWNTAATSGNAKFTVTYVTAKDGEDLTATTETVNATDGTNGTANRLNATAMTLAAANFAAGDYVGIKILRNPADAADTLGADLNLLSVYIQFTGRA